MSGWPRGIFSEGDSTKKDIGFLDDSRDADLTPTNDLVRRLGTQAVVDTPNDYPLGRLFHFRSANPPPGCETVVYFDGRRVYVRQSGWLLVGLFPSEGTHANGAMAFNRLYLVNGVNQPMSLRCTSPGTWVLQVSGPL